MILDKAFTKNVEVIGFHDLNGKSGFQMAMQSFKGRYYLYMTHYKDSGWAIIDVTEPSSPKYLKFIPGPDKSAQGTPKIQVAEGLMITALGGTLPFLHGTKPGDTYDQGIIIWDVKDPENPKVLSTWYTGAEGLGVHRFFYSGGRYVHLSSTARGFSNQIYRIIDIADPTKPVEVGRWFMPEQYWPAFTREGNTIHDLEIPQLHGPPYPKGDLVYCSYGTAGMIILDISDITLPRFVGRLSIHPPFAGGQSGARCHTVIPLSQRPFSIITSEGTRISYFSKEMIKGKAQPLHFIGVADVSDPENPTLIATFPYPEIPSGFPHKNFNEIGGIMRSFGPHNLHEPHYHPDLEDRNDRIYCAYFHAGLRVYDISDQFVPREIAYFIPPNPKKWTFNNDAGNLFPGPMIATTEDVLVDKRGYIYLDTFHDGLYILRCTV